jgi:lipoyl(octanoyl) transferase
MEWLYSQALVDYPQAVAAMERRVAAILDGIASEQIWLLEHPPLYTAGTSARTGDLLDKTRFPVYDSGRGGQFTYHGPGQRVAYVMRDLKARGEMDVRAYVQNLERWLIATLAQFGIEGGVREGRVGIWVTDKQGREAKIAALGIRVRRWVTYHGISLNVSPDLSHYAGIVPCGVHEHGVASLAALGVDASMAEVDAALASTFSNIFA